MISFGYVDSYAKTFLILQPPLENSITNIAILSRNVPKFFKNVQKYPKRFAYVIYGWPPSPVNKFYNVTDRIFRPLKESLHGFRTQMLLDVDEELFGGNMDGFWRHFDLQYVGLIFTIPRFICLFILLFGSMMATLFACQMSIMCQALGTIHILRKHLRTKLTLTR